MTRDQARVQLEASLTKVIGQWMNGLAENADDAFECYGWHGNNAATLMARCAINIMESAADVQHTMKMSGVDIEAELA